MYNPFSLHDKTILVTGASSGIGKEIAIICSKMGASVVITGRNADRLQQTMSALDGNNHIALKADMMLQDDIERIAANCPQLDGVVHCAGVGDRTPCKMIRAADFDKVIGTNLKAPILLQRMLMKSKKIKREGSIVFIASRAPFAPTVGNSLYSASKGALIAYAKVLGLEVAPQLVRVNCICPAMVWTELVERDASINGMDYTELEKKYPLKRYGKPEDIAYLAVYLLSDASCWMTGSCIDITGGVNSV